MTEEFFYHYTTKEAAKLIISDGKILPSLKANRDARYGEGVYLTTLEPGYGEATIKNNNWDGYGVEVSKTKIGVFFEIQIPSSKVVRVNNTRDIQIYKGPLQLSDYKWSLKNWDGKLLATQFFMVSSEGKAREHQRDCMGMYTIVGSLATQGGESTFVYRKNAGVLSKFLYCNNGVGGWLVGEFEGVILAKPIARLQQRVDNIDNRIHYSPSKTKPWMYYANGWRNDDKTLKVFPCYITTTVTTRTTTTTPESTTRSAPLTTTAAAPGQEPDAGKGHFNGWIFFGGLFTLGLLAAIAGSRSGTGVTEIGSEWVERQFSGDYFQYYAIL